MENFEELRPGKWRYNSISTHHKFHMDISDLEHRLQLVCDEHINCSGK
jgi:hypothetical protein